MEFLLYLCVAVAFQLVFLHFPIFCHVRCVGLLCVRNQVGKTRAGAKFL